MTHQAIESFLNRSVGVAMNPDGRYGLQCQDAFNYYCIELFGGPWTKTVRGVTGARENMEAASDEYFIKTFNDPNKPHQLPSRGDVIVWGGIPTDPYTKYGHVAIVLSANAETVTVLQQDGFAQPHQFVDGNYYSAKPAHIATLGYYNAGTGMVRGWLTPRENKIKTKEVVNMGYPYTLRTNMTSPNRSSRASFGHSGRPTGIVWHWWNSPDKAGSLEGTAAWLCNPTAQVSAHYVISGTTIYCIVSPDEAAWHAGNGRYNGSTIGIEVDPRIPAGTLETCAQLAYELETTYGSMFHYGHKDVNPGTACPGDLYPRIPQLIKMTNFLVANKGKTPAQMEPVIKPAVKPAPKPAPVKVGELDNKTMTDPVSGKVDTIYAHWKWRIPRILAHLEQLDKRLTELEKDKK